MIYIFVEEPFAVVWKTISALKGKITTVKSWQNKTTKLGIQKVKHETENEVITCGWNDKKSFCSLLEYKKMMTIVFVGLHFTSETFHLSVTKKHNKKWMKRRKDGRKKKW